MDLPETKNSERMRRRYDDAFKREAVKMLVESGKPAAVVAVSIGIDRTNLQRWKKIYGREFEIKVVESPGKSVDEKEFISLKKELESMKEDIHQLRIIVKKSLTDKYMDKD